MGAVKTIFGSHEPPFEYSRGELSLEVEKSKEALIYRRRVNKESVEKILLSEGSEIIFNPVEPVNLPKNITTYLLIELENSVLVEPKSERIIYLTFPVEIGAFLPRKKGYESFDIFSLQKPKYTLYGDIRTGIICRYHRSRVFTSQPEVDPLLEGILELRINNASSEWEEIKKVVLNSYGMKIYYSDKEVSMVAQLRIGSSGVGESTVFDIPLRIGMQRSIKLFTARKLSTGKFVMEAGL